MGLDHERLTYRHAGRDFRLTDVYGKVAKEISLKTGIQLNEKHEANCNPTIFLVTNIVLKASLQVAPPFSHNAVLQQGKPIPIWGMADAGETVTVEFGVHKTKALANASGEWKTELEALNATTKPRPLRLEPVQKILFARMWLSVRSG